MGFLTEFEAADFRLEDLLKHKQDRKIFIVFSTYGEREAGLIHDKISLLTRELGGYVDMIFLSHRRVDPKIPEKTEAMALKADRNAVIILCNDLEVPGMGPEQGKGSDMRRALYHIMMNHCNRNAWGRTVIVFLDADVLPQYFGPHFVTGLSGPVLGGFDFAKAGFWREMGRVKKFVAQPLFSVVDHPRLGGLREFSYPLSGEVAGTVDFFSRVNFWQMYGVETGINIDSCMAGARVADVNLGLYDHAHHGELGIQKMSFGIIRTYFRQLVDYGIIELKDGASISDRFTAKQIDEHGARGSLDFDLTERKYPPLADLFREK